MSGFVVYLRLTCPDDTQAVKDNWCSGAKRVLEEDIGDRHPFSWCLCSCHRGKTVEVVNPEEVKQPYMTGQLDLFQVRKEVRDGRGIAGHG